MAIDGEQIDMFSVGSSDTIRLSVQIKQDDLTDAISNKFDFDFTGEIVTNISVPDFPSEFQIGLVVGASGSGKTQLLKHRFGREEPVDWGDNDKAIVSCFGSEQDAIDRLCAVGLCSIPSWLKPYGVLSTGEKFRADLAMRIRDNAVIDEYTSTVNREVAKTCSIAVSKFIRGRGFRNIVFASCHKDIIEYLQPDWVYDMDTQQFYNGRYLQRKRIELRVVPCSVAAWRMFSKHHYLSGSLNKAAKCYMALMEDQPVGFVAVLAFPFGGCRNAYREHRLVVLPDFQGVGIGNALSECVAEMYRKEGCRYFSKTANPKCGVHRDNSPMWRPTTHNHSARPDYFRDDGTARVSNKPYKSIDAQAAYARRVCYSHEYIGDREDKGDGNV